jgi:hypothetical protein
MTPTISPPAAGTAITARPSVWFHGVLVVKLTC